MPIMVRRSPLGFSVTRLAARWVASLAGVLSAALLLAAPLARGQEPQAQAPRPEAEEPKGIPAAEAIAVAVDAGLKHTGLFHVAAPDSATWWEVAEEVLRIDGRADAVQLDTISTEERLARGQSIARRPADSRLSSEAFATAGMYDRLPVAWLGSTITGRWLACLITGIAEMSRVLRVALSNVRIPRSQSMTSLFPLETMYSAARRSSSTVDIMPRFRRTGFRTLPTASRSA